MPILNRRLIVITAAFLWVLCGLDNTRVHAQGFIESGEAMVPPRGALSLCVEDRETCGLPSGDLAEDRGSSDQGLVTEGSSAEPEAIKVNIVLQEGVNPWVLTVPARDRPIHLELRPRVEAEPDSVGAPSIMNDEQVMAHARIVNARINAVMRYRSDEIIWGVEERWVRPLTRYKSRFGDCEDFALEKRSALLEAGVPAERLRMAVVWSRSTGVHAVLILRTSDGDFVLDNAERTIRRVDETNYEWRSIQSGPHLLSWGRAVVRTPETALSEDNEIERVIVLS